MNRAISKAMDGAAIFVDLLNKNSYYIPRSFNIVRKVSLEQVKWELTNESKTILGLKTYKAIATLEQEQYAQKKN